MDLDKLFTHYGSDKTKHGYAAYYHALFKNLKDKVDLSLLEIGIGTMIPGAHSSMVGYSLPGYKPGGSLRAWRDYFKHGTIVGLDVQPDTQFTDEPRITTYLCNTADSKATQKWIDDNKVKQFDVVLDDGSHMEQSQLSTLSNLYKLVKPGGFYIIEDVYVGNPAAFLQRVQQLCPDALVFTNVQKQLYIVSKR